MRNSKNGIWNIVNNTLGKSTGKDANNLRSITEKFDTLTEAANEINNHFASIFVPSPDWSQLRSRTTSLSVAWSPFVDTDIVLSYLQNLKKSKSSGSDDLSPRLLSECALEFSGPLSHLINVSIQTGCVPRQWKIANIAPVPKTKNPSLSDLRPISLLPVMSKILEKSILKHIKERLLQCYGYNQFGFRSASSTLHAQIYIHEFVTSNLDLPETSGVLLISFDMSKAFDRLSHDSIIDTLIQFSFPKKFVHWICDYLQDRCQRVCLNSHIYSSIVNVSSGVPQGSILGPYLFNVQLSSLRPFSTSASMIKYADDIIVLVPYCNNDSVDHLIHLEMSNMINWCSSRGLLINQSKTNCMLFSCSNFRPTVSSDSLLCNTLRILGVLFQDNLRWDQHKERTCKLAARRVKVLRVLKTELSKEDLITVYKVYILSILEYNSPLFVGISKKESLKIEAIRKRSHRIICGKDCTCSHFIPLSDRRESRALKEFKALLCTDSVLNYLSPQRLTFSGHLRVPILKSKRRACSFIPYCTVLYNKLYAKKCFQMYVQM